MTKFVFDLDGTLTSKETLPIICQKFNIKQNMDDLTKQTIIGNIPFIESFIKRVHILGHLPIDEVSELLANIPLHLKIVDFIQKHKQDCIIATGNLDCWIGKLISKINCQCYCSKCDITDNKVIKLTKILHKEEVVAFYKAQNEKVVFIGDGNNDVEAMRIADISIASGLTHFPAQSVLSTADYIVFSEEALCRQLNQLL